MRAVSEEFCAMVLDRAFENGSETLLDGRRVLRGDRLGNVYVCPSPRPWELFLVSPGTRPLRVLTSGDLAEALGGECR